MSAASNAVDAALGFLCIRHFASQGYLGGYLIVDRYGHPLSFHCTEPVEPSRLQAILYGATLERFLLGRRIAVALVHKGQPRPQAVLVDHPAALAGAEELPLPLALLVQATPPGQDCPTAQATENAPRVPCPVCWLTWGSYRLGVAGPGEQKAAQLRQVLQGLDECFDLHEPFLRIQQALEEARQAA